MNTANNMYIRETFSRGLVFAERKQRRKRTHVLTYRMFKNPSRNHAQRSLVMSVLA